MMNAIPFLLLIAVLAYWWKEMLRHRDIAHHLCRRTCQELQVQLLDDTVVLNSLRPVRDTVQQRWVLARDYRFEFFDGEARWQGSLMLHGTRLHLLTLPGHLNRTLITPAS